MTTAAGVGASGGTTALATIIVHDFAHSHGVELTPDVTAAWAMFLWPFVHFFGTALSLIGTAILGKLSNLAGVPVPSSVQPDLVLTASKS